MSNTAKSAGETRATTSQGPGTSPAGTFAVVEEPLVRVLGGER